MPRKIKPHPRSLDALFGPAPVQKKPPVLCPAGHRQSSRWKPTWGCTTCDTAKAAQARAEAALLEKAKWREIMGPVPAVLEMRVTSTGKVIRYAIPKHLQKRRPRGPRRRRRV